MSAYTVNRLAGMQDLSGANYWCLRKVSDGIGRYLESCDFEVVGVPLLEQTELFVRKSGGELTNRLYSFIDPAGNSVSLRPEFTPSVIRCFIERGESVLLPGKWYYSGPVVRYDENPAVSYRQFTQVGAEVIGAGGAKSDAEVIGLACEGLKEAGLPGVQVRIGHLGVLNEFLSSLGLSGRARLMVISNVQNLKRGHTDVAELMGQARELGLFNNGLPREVNAVDSQVSESADSFTQGALADAVSAPFGRRSGQQIVSRLMRKAREVNQPDDIQKALDVTRQITQVEGTPDTALTNARLIAASYGLQSPSLEALNEVFETIVRGQVPESQLTLDFGLARGIAYYTGITFELVHASAAGRLILGGGGRYDGLVKALGGDDVPALGFAFTMEQVVAGLQRESEASELGIGGNDASVSYS